MDLSEFAVKVLKKYAKQRKMPVRSTSDLSPLEEHLIIELYHYHENKNKSKKQEE